MNSLLVNGNWPNRDPMGEQGGMNLYAYVDNDPVDLIDPFGFAPTLNELFWQNVYESGGQDAARFTGRIGQSVLSMAKSSLYMQLDPIGAAYDQYQGVANLSQYLGNVSADP